MDEWARVLNLNISLSQPNETYFTFETLLFEIGISNEFQISNIYVESKLFYQNNSDN